MTERSITPAEKYEKIKKYTSSIEIKNVFAGILGDKKAESYVYSVIVAVSRDPNLLNCSPQSIVRAATQAATLGLSVDPNVGQAYMVPYKGQATLQVGWRGIRDMAFRSKSIALLNTGTLEEGQEWVEDQLTGRGRIEGHPTSNKIIGYFAYMKTFSGREHFEYMTKDEVEAHRNRYAQGYERAGSAWKTAFDNMARKTVLKRLLTRWAELDPAGVEIEGGLDRALMADDLPDEDEVTEAPRKPNAQIMQELGYDYDDEGVIDAEFEDADIEPEIESPPQPAPRARTQPKKQAPMPKKTGYPISEQEYYSWIAQGAFEGVSVKDAKAALAKAQGELDIAWELLKANKQQPGLL